MPDQNSNGPTPTQDPWAVVASAPASTPTPAPAPAPVSAPAAAPTTTSPTTPAADPWAVVAHEPQSQPSQQPSTWDRIKQSVTNNPISNYITKTLATPSEWAEQRRQANLVAAAQGKPQPYSDNVNMLLDEAGTAGRMLGGLTQPKNLALLPAAEVAPITTAAYVGGQGAQMLLAPRHPEETPAQEEERRLMGASMLFGGVGGGAKAAEVNAPDLGIRSAEQVGRAATVPVKAVGDKINAVKEAYSPSSLTENVRRASPPSKGYAAEYAQTLKAAEPQLRDIFRENPDVRSPQDVVTAIQERIDSIESHLEAVAKGMEKTPGAPPQASVLQNAQLEVGKALDQYFEDKRGAFTPEQIQGARDQIIERLAQKGGRDPSLYEAENLRKQLNDETKTPLEVPSAARDAKQVAVKVLRQLIDNKFEEMGVPEVKEWRAQEAPLIDVRDQLVDGFAKAEKMGKWSLIKSTLDNFRTGALGAALGGITGGIFGLPAGLTTGGVVEAGAIGREYLKDLETNPNRATQRAVRIAGEEPAPTNVHNPLTAVPTEQPIGAAAGLPPDLTPKPTPKNPTNGAASTAPAPATGNYSGESAASTEAINRVAAEKSNGVKIFRIDTRNPKVEIPVYGVDAVDARPSPYEKIVRRDASGHEFVLSRGLKAY